MYFRLAMSPDEKKDLGVVNPGLDFSNEAASQQSTEKTVSFGNYRVLIEPWLVRFNPWLYCSLHKLLPLDYN